MLEIDESLTETEPDSRSGLGSNFILRHPKHADLGRLVSLATNPVLSKNVCSTWLPTTMQAADLWFTAMLEDTDPASYPFVLTDMRGNGLGAANLELQGDRTEAEISILIEQANWNKGYATMALQAIADFAFSNPNTSRPPLTSVIARCRVTCTSARRVVEKCGFQYCGTGMAQSQHFRGMIPIDRYRLDRGIWTALRHWAGSIHLDLEAHKPANLDVKGAA